MKNRLHIGLLINPLAGLGGSLALKGSDGEAAREVAKSLPGDKPTRAELRVKRTLEVLAACPEAFRISTWAGAMGARMTEDVGLTCEVCGGAASGVVSGPDDTRQAAQELQAQGIDLLVFAGGDGTARDVFDAVGNSLPVLGVPAGVKMHSGVFAVSPEAAGELLLQLAQGSLVGLTLKEVRDIDEEAFRQDRVRSRFYGELRVPGEGRYLQHNKVGGRESQDLVAADIGAWLAEHLIDDCCYLVGPGSTTAAFMAELGLANTLLGVDVVCDGVVLVNDATEAQLLAVLHSSDQERRMVVTPIGGQGFVFGRGNQQFSPAVIRAVGLDNIVIIAAKSKITSLGGRPLLVDTNDRALDLALCGYRQVVTGYEDHILYRLATLEVGGQAP